MSLAYGGSRVLVDADMRRPGLHRPLRLTNERGLSQVLVGQARVRDVIQRTVDPNLMAITAGHAPPNPSELLASGITFVIGAEMTRRRLAETRDRDHDTESSPICRGRAEQGRFRPQQVLLFPVPR